MSSCFIKPRIYETYLAVAMNFDISGFDCIAVYLLISCNVFLQHSLIILSDDLQVVLINLSKVNPTTLNNIAVQDAKVVAHNDIFTVADRSFRVEFPHGSPSHVVHSVSNFCMFMSTLCGFVWSIVA